ncbi:unnamed protein product [Coregonus sp. 'balchen']|nr:unnamed protein product [Coregonus sp. 'balchen']
MENPETEQDELEFERGQILGVLWMLRMRKSCWVTTTKTLEDHVLGAGAERGGAMSSLNDLQYQTARL